jgi:predicted nucleotidyltransferase
MKVAAAPQKCHVSSSPIDGSRLRAVRSLCRRHHVRRLDLFGSAVTGRFDLARSDLDMLVTFDDLPPGRYADAYFGLKSDLERLFGRDVDLVTAVALQNPFFRREVETHRQTLFAAG